MPSARPDVEAVVKTAATTAESVGMDLQVTNAYYDLIGYNMDEVLRIVWPTARGTVGIEAAKERRRTMRTLTTRMGQRIAKHFVAAAVISRSNLCVPPSISINGDVVNRETALPPLPQTLQSHRIYRRVCADHPR